MKTYQFLDNIFEIQSFDKAKGFASFLPAIAGVKGKPLWVFYTNIGQCVGGFGIDNKDTPFTPFDSYKKARKEIPVNGFRTFIKINGKIYIGKTCANPPENRWRKDGSGYMKSPLFWNAIQKYGWNNFEHEILIKNLTELEANEEEKRFISILRSNDRQYGYNITDGGEGVRLIGENHPRYGIHLDDDLKNKISESHKKLGLWKGENNPNYGRHDFVGDGNPFYGKTHTEESKKKMSDARKNKPSPNKGKHMSAEQKVKISKSRLDKKPVLQFDLNDNLVSEYESLSQASNITGYDRSNISACCNGRIKTSHNFVWRYKNSEQN